jgi:hypothetical protein
LGYALPARGNIVERVVKQFQGRLFETFTSASIGLRINERGVKGGVCIERAIDYRNGRGGVISPPPSFTAMLNNPATVQLKLWDFFLRSLSLCGNC